MTKRRAQEGTSERGSLPGTDRLSIVPERGSIRVPDRYIRFTKAVKCISRNVQTDSPRVISLGNVLRPKFPFKEINSPIKEFFIHHPERTDHLRLNTINIDWFKRINEENLLWRQQGSCSISEMR